MALGNRKKQPLIVPKLNITSMMDMFTIILIFLLFSFSNNPETLDLDKEMFLPSSSSKLDYKDSIRLVLTKESLKLDGEVVSTVKEGVLENLDVLYEKLKNYRTVADKLNKEIKQDPNVPEEERKEHILFMCDKTLSFKVINTVVKTAGRAGYPNFQFAVVEKE